MADLPIMLNIRGRRCVVVGGGAVAVRRAGALREAGAAVTVIAPRMDPRLEAMDVTLERREYRRGDLAGALLAVVATGDRAVNAAVAEEARGAGVLLNRADEPEAGDFTVPAHARHGPVTLAVATGGISAAAAAAIRRELSAALDPDWPRLLEIVAPFRTMMQARLTDSAQRQARLMLLTDPTMMALLKREGDAAVRRRCEELTDLPPPPDRPEITDAR